MVSVLFNEPKLLKFEKHRNVATRNKSVSVLFNEPKLLKFRRRREKVGDVRGFQCSSTSRNC